ncbi:hypothetical protein D9753_07285 [Streptomyces dangxiongensis]|uniref:Uncharacterized protein n=1 Tax=Streptomyces dangxiongensis TaxID=1442032 RepID=A0A3G2JMB7_9ACTN|nr:hypothetical protein D9753_07285 [Streptomyces dangxiongensis]
MSWGRLSASFTRRDGARTVGAGRSRTGVAGRPWRPATYEKPGAWPRPSRAAGRGGVRRWPNHRSSGIPQDCPGACWASIPP